jgi:hypothetical protein
MRLLTTFAASAAVLLALVGCAASQDTVVLKQSPTATASASASAQPSAEASEESELQGPQPNATPSACSFDVQDGIQQSITSQTQAFAAEDFELAYSFASPSFRANVNLQSFVSVIASSYGPLISSSELEFSECLSNEEKTIGLINVRFVEGDTDLYGLRYLMVATDEGWRVEGASNLELVASGS